ncbi:carbohydrate kinase [Galbibacter sp. EGI 63066]|uniref:carbohydrate kinase family protein n=1 Tax=Galbibacter sp. EGI 63066 TaxID=2993559 RepID=UPI002248DC89|nr:carbohydrate kinase [Galbibacter sp. EGI 63066]MCX2681751.1 carbohydrate kinase [Galbibacter sp. EGI 63066]
MEKKIKGVSYGEILWDVFPDKKKIGGAPLNVALRMQALGCDMAMVSAVGNDEDGQQLVTFLNQHNISIEGVQVKKDFPTGNVTVQLDNKGCASYIINYPVSWDKIEPSQLNKELVKKADILVFGSLICRDTISKSTLLELLSVANFKVFDVNLRPPHYSYEVLEELMMHSDFIKFNDEELFEIAEKMGSNKKTIRENILFIANKTKTKAICITKGAEGAILYWDNEFYSSEGYSVNVVDTVGAGDSFLGSLITKLYQNTHPEEAIDYACAIGALVASKEGANPVLQDSDVENLRGIKR